MPSSPLKYHLSGLAKSAMRRPGSWDEVHRSRGQPYSVGSNADMPGRAPKGGPLPSGCLTTPLERVPDTQAQPHVSEPVVFHRGGKRGPAIGMHGVMGIHHLPIKPRRYLTDSSPASLDAQ